MSNDMTATLEEKQQRERLNSRAVLSVLEPEGPLAQAIKGFESRPEQVGMMQNVLDAYNSSEIALIEAGTGTGKSLAYLVPALLWAAQTKERTVISTNTIPLQEQLLHKDIPTVLKALKLDLQAVLVKGMGNYLCLRKFYETQEEILLMTPQEADDMQKISGWKENTKDGSRASLPFNPSPAMWEKLCAESDTCNRMKCPYYEECLFFKARHKAADAQILVVNHHILFVDLIRRLELTSGKDPGLLPAYSRLIIDEAHNIEEIATDYFASQVNQMEILRLIARLSSEAGTKIHGKLPLLKEKLLTHYRNKENPHAASLLQKLTYDLPGYKQELLKSTHDTFLSFFEFVQRHGGTAEEKGQGENKLRLLDNHRAESLWVKELVPQAKQLNEALQKYAISLSTLEKEISYLKNPEVEEQLKGIVYEVQALAGRLSLIGTVLEEFMKDLPPPNKVRWVELQWLKSALNTSLMDANLDISKLLVDHLFHQFPTIVMCSATLTTSKQFHFIRSRLGLVDPLLQNRTVKEHIYDSPFEYRKQALLGIPTDIPNPSDPTFITEAARQIGKYLCVSRGNAFVLFTSYTMLKACYEILSQDLRDHKFHFLKQGDADRQSLLTKFRNTNRSVLFGTDSFWEGVDVVGDALRCVIIVKLPFRVPSDPLVQARSEALQKVGKDPFMEYSLPQAVVKFKQGFGRLIRNRNDRGCVICLDNRILSKRYGKMFLNSLPECQQAFISCEELVVEMEKFYRRTYPLTGK